MLADSKACHKQQCEVTVDLLLSVVTRLALSLVCGVHYLILNYIVRDILSGIIKDS